MTKEKVKNTSVLSSIEKNMVFGAGVCVCRNGAKNSFCSSISNFKFFCRQLKSEIRSWNHALYTEKPFLWLSPPRPKIKEA